MNRQNYQQYGLIIAIIVAGVSLPLGIVGITREPIVNNYYTENYYTITNNTTIINNNTTLIDAEDDYSRPLEVFEYTNLTYNEYFADMSFNMSADNTLCMFSNETYPSFTLFIVQDSMVSYFYDGHRCWTRTTQVDDFVSWTPDGYNSYHLIFENDQGSGLESVKVYIEIL